MKLLIQRVSTASVEIDNQIVSSIQQGVLALVGFDKHDNSESLISMAEKLLNFKIFNDHNGRISRSILETNYQLLVVPQVTLSVGTKKGSKPSFSKAADPKKSFHFFQEFIQIIKRNNLECEIGSFGSDMLVRLVNDGPVTFWFEN
ncbi:D-aminoacyl-tRNA deacylase [Gammaproteobacteria bacterium]|nr:D-aminoacyl-tRNA deacylase [Gammaproteobacteria bacterium]